MFLDAQKIQHTSSFKSIGIVRICTQSEIINFTKHLYFNTNLFLERKRNKLGPVINKLITEHTTNSGKPQQVMLEAIPS